jgi:hypothetical protein
VFSLAEEYAAAANDRSAIAAIRIHRVEVFREAERYTEVLLTLRLLRDQAPEDPELHAFLMERRLTEARDAIQEAILLYDESGNRKGRASALHEFGMLAIAIFPLLDFTGLWHHNQARHRHYFSMIRSIPINGTSMSS